MSNAKLSPLKAASMNLKVLIVGSTHDGITPTQRPVFEQACRQLGGALARANFEIIVGSESPNTADRYVLEGFAEEKGRRRVWVLRPESGETPFASSSAKFSERIEFCYQRLRGTWEAGHVPQILASDAILLVAGSTGTLTVGFVAPALERAVLAIPCFGGAAERLWSDFEPYYLRLGELSQRVGNLRESWQPENAELAIRILAQLIARRSFRSNPRIPMILYNSFLLTCLLFWVVLFANPFSNPAYSLFSMLGLAGLIGTFLKTNLRMVFDPTASFSWNELFIEIGTGLLLAFALALLYLIGALTITGTTEAVRLAKDDGFQRVAVVMTLLGLGGGLMTEHAADAVRGWFTSAFKA